MSAAPQSSIGEQLKLEGIDRILGRRESSRWISYAKDVVRRLAASGEEFSGDQVVEIAGPAPNRFSMGALFSWASRERIIIRTGFAPSKRPECHAHLGPTYRGVKEP